MPREADIAEISQIFLSATAQDCKHYREAVRDFVQNNIQTAKIFLQENWAEGGNFVVDVCKDRIETCHGYLGLFGYRYGWTPPGFTMSITELEFQWAVARWNGQCPPIFIFLPVKNSQADKQLRKWAESFLELEFPEETARSAAVLAQKQFLSRVNQWASNGHLLVLYSNRKQLLGKALSCIQNWNNALLRQAPPRRRKAPGDIPDEELGRIGRERQLDALKHALEAFHERENQWAIAFLVHGSENHGQRMFAEFLARWDEWEDVQMCDGQPTEPYDTISLIAWTCGQLQEPAQEGPTVEKLATVLAARLRVTSLMVLLRSLGPHRERLAKFQSRFWQPLLEAVAACNPGSKGRLYCFVIDHETLAPASGPAIRTEGLNNGDVDYRQLLALPALTPIDAIQVQRWLKSLWRDTGIKIAEERRREIGQRATAPDGYPTNVYDRLAREGFWANGA